MRIACCLLALGALAQPARAAAPPVKPDTRKADKALREVAGTAEYLRSLPKRFGVLVGIDASRRRVTIRFDGEKAPREWPLLDDAEIKVDGWWGRPEQLAAGERVWVWLTTDRKKQPVAIAMIADDLSQQDIHGTGVTVVKNGGGILVVKPEKGPDRVLQTRASEAFQGQRPVKVAEFAAKSKVFVRSRGEEAVLVLDAAAFERRRAAQREALRKHWLERGLPGGVSFVHVFSGEMDLMLDHEAMRWARSLQRGDKVTLSAEPPIAAVVKDVQPWRERTQVRLVARARDLADLRPGQRLNLKMSAPSPAVENGKYPPDIDRPRERGARIEWFLASIYCTCGVRGDTCTGHFYTLASCNPNGCGMPNQMRQRIATLIDKGLSNRQIFDKLLEEQGPGLTQPHLLP